MRRFMMVILTLATLISGAALMNTKYTVQEKARELEMLADQIHADKKAIRVLRAEWAFQTTPNKLQDKSLEYLALMPVLSTQVMLSVDDIPFRRNPTQPVAGAEGVLLPGVKRKGDVKKISGSRQKAESVSHTAGAVDGQSRSMLVRLSAYRTETKVETRGQSR